MTLIVAIDTASDLLSVAARTGAGALAARRHAVPRDHARVLLPLLADLLDELGGTAEAITEVRVTDGPGSFTGLRVGAAVAKAIAFRSGVVLRVTSAMLLPVLALPEEAGTGEAVVLRSALRGEWYRARYRRGPGRTLTTIEAPRVVTGADLFTGDLPAWVLGAGVPEAMALLAEAPQTWRTRWMSIPEDQTGALALLALDTWRGDARWIEVDRMLWEPAYGRPAEAVHRWEIAHGRTLPSRSPGTR